MKKQTALIYFGLLLCLLFNTKSLAISNYETVVTDTSFSTSSRIVINQEEIQSSKAPNLTSLLQSQANISTSNSNFQPGSFYIRGGDAGHVLILVDGVPYYDGTTSQRTINLNSININFVKRIEIIKGSQSVLYGGQALSAVIKIETLPVKMTTSTSANAALGSNAFQQFAATQVLKLSDFDAMSASVSYYGKRNLSPVTDSNFRYPSRVRDFDLSYLHREDWDLISKINMTSETTEIGGSDPLGKYLGALDTKDFITKNDQRSLTLIAKKNSGILRPRLSLIYQNSDRLYEQGINEFNSSLSKQTYGGDNVSARAELEHRPNFQVQNLIGVQYTRESLVYRNLDVETANTSQELRGFFAKSEVEVLPYLVVVAGGRLDGENRNQLNQASDFTSTYQVGLRAFQNSKLEYSTGFKTPSLFQYIGTYGNPDLKSERSNNLSFTQDLPLGNDQFFSVTLFETNFTNLIQVSGSPQKYTNIDSSRTRGAEASFEGRYNSGTDLRVALGYQEPKDLSNDTWLARRPLQSGSARISQKLDSKNSGYFEVFGNGERRDQSYRYGPPRYVNLSTTVISNAAYNRVIDEQWSAFVRVNNLGDLRYEESFGYLNEGRSFQVGANYIL